jgi:nucleotide-binding universal stress UspA family protein
MTRRILVPLDGSRLAESALPYALALARALEAGLVLLHVLERRSAARVHGDTHATTAEEAERYLAGVAERLAGSGSATPVDRHVHVGSAEGIARSIADHRLELPYDLVVLCTHGAGGAGRALLGSVGQRVLAGASVPVLLVRPDSGAPPGAVAAVRFDSLLLAFEAAHPGALPLATELARSCSAGLHLLMVIPTYGTRRGGMRLIGRYLPGATLAALEMETEAAEILLKEKLAELHAAGLEATSEVVRGSPVPAILNAVASRNPGLTVMATHGRRGLGAVWTGSVASDVCARSTRPVLLVPVP